eukprot:6318646-Prymnesium_polylepis.1
MRDRTSVHRVGAVQRHYLGADPTHGSQHVRQADPEEHGLHCLLVDGLRVVRLVGLVAARRSSAACAQEQAAKERQDALRQRQRGDNAAHR